MSAKRTSMFVLLLFIPLFVLGAQENGNGHLNGDDAAAAEKKDQETQSYEDSRISRHQPLYIIAGEPDTKIQISFKVQILKKAQLFLAYTQQMYWELGTDSNPFEDVNFNPEVFYRYSIKGKCFVRSIDFGIYEHKSNGKGGLDSRGWSRSYVKLNTATKFGNWTFNWDTKVFGVYQFSLDKTNLNIRDYMGFWEMRFSIFNYFDPDELIDRAEIYFAFNPGGKYSHILKYGSQEFGLRFRIGGDIFNPSIFFQVFHGYNESMLDYDQSHWAYRVGFAF